MYKNISAVFVPVPPYQLSANSSYIATLDGLRALAIGLVVIGHIGLGDMIPGGFGVTVFFFISGFLITRLLLAEYGKNGRIAIANFYKRRILRLAPALVVVVLVQTSIFYLQKGFVPWADVFSALFYLYNYYKLFWGQQMQPLASLWSLAVEEHYYFVFPYVFSKCAQTLTRFVISLTIVCILVLIWRLILVYKLHILSTIGDYPFDATDCRIDSILYGAILSLAVQQRTTARHVQQLMTWYWFAIGLAMLLLTFVIRSEEFRQTWRYTIQGLALLPLFTCSLFGPQFGFVRALLEIRPLVWVGKISYSLYLWHFPIQYLFQYFFPEASLFARFTICLPAMLVVSAASYYFVEQPFVSLRRRLHETDAPAAVAPAPLH